MADDAITVSSNAAAVSVQYRDAPKLVSTNLYKILNRVGATLQLGIIRDKLSAGRSVGQQLLSKRTGTLQRAIFYRIELQGDDAVLIIGADASKAPYAAAQEYGATIHPVKGKFLTIPLDPALTASGVARVSAKEFISNPGSLGFDKTFVNKAKTAIMGVTGAGQVQAVFALKTEVVIPEHAYIRSEVAERKAWILDQLGAAGTTDAGTGG